MDKFTGLGQRVQIDCEGFALLHGRTGTVNRIRTDGGAWVDIHGGLPASLRRFPVGDEHGRGNHIILYPDECVKAER